MSQILHQMHMQVGLSLLSIARSVIAAEYTLFISSDDAKSKHKFVTVSEPIRIDSSPMTLPSTSVHNQ